MGGFDRSHFEVHIPLAVVVLLNVNDEDFAIWENMAPGCRRHVGNNDKGIFWGRFQNGSDEIVGFGIAGALGTCQDRERFTPG